MHDIHFEVQFNAPVDRLFAAFHETELLVQWFAPGDLVVSQVMSNFEQGGAIRLTMMEPDGSEHRVLGEYQQIEKDQKLVFSWQWEGEDDASLVSLDFSAIDANTSRLQLSHTDIVSEEAGKEFQQIWIACLEKLSVVTL